MTEAGDEPVADRAAAVERTSGSGTDLFDDDYLAEHREDWPE